MEDVSDAGGVAARFGFKYQDHVAARFVLQMISDRRITKVECEVGDDVTVFHARNGAVFPEYVQVKTTDKDKKWTVTELLGRKIADKPTSIPEKSLLCDCGQAGARFRIVAKRGVNKTLLPLQDPIEGRAEPQKIQSLSSSFRKKYPKTVSSNGNDLGYWVANTVWEVFSNIDHIRAINMQAIRELADDERTSISNKQATEIYGRLLQKVEDAAGATRRNKEDKKIERSDAVRWFKDEIEVIRRDPRSRGTPYRARAEKFFLELHTLPSDALKRSSSSYDAQYQRKKWRCAEMAQYLTKWVVELTLRASELIEVDQLNIKQLLASSIKKLSVEGPVDENRLFGETLLHAILRHWFRSEPIACKLFHRSSLGDQVTRNAHVIHDTEGDQLWLGRTKICSGGTVSEIFENIKGELVSSLQTDVLLEERDTIIQLYEPQFLTGNDLGDALESGAPIDALISVLCLSILIVYDSAILSQGHVDNYRDLLIAETQQIAITISKNLPEELEEVRFHLFLVPVENASTLLSSFSAALKAA